MRISPAPLLVRKRFVRLGRCNGQSQRVKDRRFAVIRIRRLHFPKLLLERLRARGAGLAILVIDLAQRVDRTSFLVKKISTADRLIRCLSL
jgi:hypothetical protein